MEQIYKLLIDKLTEEGVEAQVYISGEDPVLRLSVEDMGPDRDGIIVMEFSAIPVEDENHLYFHTLTAIVKDIPEEDYSKILLKLNVLNQGAVLGHYGILPEQGIIYHRYSPKVLKAPNNQLAQELFEIIYDVIGVINNDFVDVFLSMK